MNLQSGALSGARRPALLVHGGAWSIPEEEHEAHRDGLRQALERGRTLLEAGASALDVVAETVAVMEAHPAFDAGRGSVLNRQGEVELDAGIMHGPTLQFGAVAGIKHFMHPVQIARRLLEKGQRGVAFLIGYGAEAFALQEGFPYIHNEELIVEREWKRYRQLRESRYFHPSHAFQPPEAPCPRDTVGCVALDVHGELAAATSTGGTPLTWPGRVGDSPLPGCGYYATPDAAVSTTGWGEAIAAFLLAGRTAESVAQGMAPEAAARTWIQRLYETIQNDCHLGATAGLIVLNARGEGGWAFSTPHMARGAWRAGEDMWVAV